MDKDTETGRERRDLRICYCAWPFSGEGVFIHALTVAAMLERTCDRLSVIAPRMPQGVSFGPDVHTITLRVTMRYIREQNQPRWLSILKWPLKYIAQQIEISYHLARVSGQTDIVVLYTGPHYVLPVIVAKLLRKKIVKYSAGSPEYAFSSSIVQSFPKLSINYWVLPVMKIFEWIINSLSDRIVMPTEGSIQRVGMGKWRGKISAAMYMCMSDIFQEKKDWHSRNDVVGYIGRLMEVKGVLQLAQAIPLILQRKKDARFLIVGDGVLMAEMKRYLEEAGCLDRVDFVGWVPSEAIPDYLNEMKFHILPSYFEAPGAINLEAMACGTIVIANAVGGIPDIVRDNETGFLLKDNAPRTIADKVIEAWDHPGLERIRQNARVFVEQNFSCGKVIDDWRRIFSEL